MRRLPSFHAMYFKAIAVTFSKPEPEALNYLHAAFDVVIEEYVKQHTSAISQFSLATSNGFVAQKMKRE